MTEGTHDGRRTRITARQRELRFDAGSLSLNLIATVGRRPTTPIERMGDIERLTAWFAGWGSLCTRRRIWGVCSPPSTVCGLARTTSRPGIYVAKLPEASRCGS
ncbi:hypothetical protein [Streptomyces sp. MBT84]|uniref:hypothetical protein n=1 Tax=Streptomyces sp. MBT84 TaxID=1488414 RepID=UPI002076829D|nr:hypothetical protein [Streptomyces sp. MBT84]